MRRLLLIAGVAALALPGLASAQPGCMEPQHDNRVAGTAAGDAAITCGGFTQVGSYDDTGVWRAGPGYRDANGDWRQASGYYDGDGDWVDVAPPPASQPAPSPPNAGDNGADAAYTGTSDDLASRESWLEQRIHEGDSSGAISRGDAEHDFDVLAGIRQFQAHRADADGGLSGADRTAVAKKVDDLSDTVHAQWRY